MKISFHKYQSTGNDFVLLDNRTLKFPKTDSKLIRRLCDRRFGIGADGLIILEESEKHDFIMVYFNADGAIGSFCGNGSRAVVHFAGSLGIISTECNFEAYDGVHQGKINGNRIRIKMGDVQNGRELLNGTFLDTGSPHYLEIVKDLDNLDVKKLGKELRDKNEFKPNGSNINFIEKTGNHQIKVRTYERGVEDETLSCGTGVTAAAIVAAEHGMGKNIQIHTLGGDLSVSLETTATSFENIWLEGPTERVFSGEIMI